jgi:tripartite-type tricarboxylate transporter receptor subunit TctC
MHNVVIAFAQRLNQTLGQQVIVESKPGANGTIGTHYVAKAPADGYTLLASDPQLVNSPSLYRKLPYDPLKDLVPVAGLATADHALAVNPSLPIKNVKDLIDLAKAKPGELTYASIGVGSTQHLEMEMLQSMAGIKLNHIPYKGSGAALTDVAAGNVHMMFAGTGGILPFGKSGKLRIIGVSTPKRNQHIPHVPTIAEQGVPGFDAGTWYGLHGPAGMPKSVIDKINKQVQTIQADPDFRAKVLTSSAFEPLVGSPEDFSAFLKVEASRWSKIINDAGVKLD